MSLLRRSTDDGMVVEKGPGLARGPAHIVGSILLAFGLAAMIKHNQFPPAATQFPDGTATGGTFLGFEANGWTSLFTAAAGGLLLFGAAHHVLARTMSLLVGLALGACAVIALIDGDVLGLAAANRWTELGWGIAAAILVLNALMPRVSRRRPVEGAAVAGPTADAIPRGTVTRERDTVVREDGTATVRRTGRFEREPAATEPAATERESVRSGPAETPGGGRGDR
jgi:hypothetical protein